MEHCDDAARREIIEGLSAERARIAPKYFYDALGSRLFEIITHLPEYYPTRIERAVMAEHADDIAAAIGTGVTLIDLGAGNCEKARALFAPLAPRQYVAVDISSEYLDRALTGLVAAFPGIDMVHVRADLTAGLVLPESVRGERRVFFYPGSSIGNFDPQDALALLSRVRQLCAHDGGLLIGVDLVKQASILESAYDDALGVTAAFNLNVLNHVNALIGSDFTIRDWEHRSFYDSSRSRVEIHLEAACDLAVRWPGGGRRFAAGERIHTENSYKYVLEDFTGLLARAGFTSVDSWTDERRWFAVCLAHCRT